jgi:predicted kinase
VDKSYELGINMPKVIILCGKIACGKTYYGNYLREKLRGIILSVDDLMLALSDHCLGDNHDDIANRCEQYFYKLAESMILQGINVIIDFGYWKKSERQEARTFFQKRNIPMELHYVSINEEKRLNQLEERNERLIKESSSNNDRVYIISEELRARLDSKFEIPTKDEIDVVWSDFLAQ